jgi:proteasome lid subunit RPN8/RPN11
VSLVLRTEDVRRIRRHGEESFPYECCGVLIGRPGPESRIVESIIAVENERGDSRHNRFLITPDTLLKAEKEARARGLDVLGFYHSHPGAPARPSEYDREHAWPAYSYVIVSVYEGESRDVTSWTLADDRTRFDAEEITTTMEVS